MVTVFKPLTTTGAEESVLHATGETRFVVDCKLNHAALAGQVMIRFDLVLSKLIVSRGGETVSVSSVVTLPKPPELLAIRTVAV